MRGLPSLNTAPDTASAPALGLDPSEISKS